MRYKLNEGTLRTKGVLHHNGAGCGGILTRHHDLRSDIAERFCVGKRKVSILSRVDLGAFGENGAISFVQIGGKHRIKPVEERGIHFASVGVVDIVDLVMCADVGESGKLGC